MDHRSFEITNCEKCGAEIRGDLCEFCYSEKGQQVTPGKSSRLKKAFKFTATFTLLVCVWLWINPLLRLRSENMIRQNLLEETPLGLHVERVDDYINKKWPGENIVLPREVRKKIIGPVQLGWYWTSIPGLPMITGVFATWKFDENGRLIDVRVKKEVDAP